MERPYGLTLVGNYAMVARRHMEQYGTTPEQLAEIAVTTRRHAITVIRQNGQPFFRARIPYVVGLIDLDEGFRMLAEIAAEPDSVH